MPDADLEALQPQLVERRNVRKRRHALLRSHRIRLHLAALDLGGGIGGLVAHEIHLAAEQIVHRRRGALVGNGQELGLDGAHEQQSAQMRGRSDPCVRQSDLVLVRLDVSEELLEILRREALPADDRHRHVVDEADVLEILERIEAQAAVQRRRRRHADMVDQDRVAVRLRVLHLLGRQNSARARAVLDEDRLAQGLAHRLRHHAGDGIGRSARGIGNQHDDRPCRIILRRCARRCRERRKGQQVPQSFHFRLLLRQYLFDDPEPAVVRTHVPVASLRIDDRLSDADVLRG